MLDSLFVAAANHLLAAAPWARERLAPHAREAAQIRIGPLEFGFEIEPDGLLGECTHGEEPAVVITLPASARLLAGGIEAAMREARVSGTVDTADALGFVFRHLRWDAEGDLARLIGDIPAHRAARFGAGLLRSQHRVFGTLSENLREAVAEERTPLLSRIRAEAHREALRELRDALARLDKRLVPLERRAPR